MANKRTSASDKAHLAAYKSQKTWEKNRRRKLERTLKAQPNNKQVELALGSISYRRKTPKTQQWTGATKSTAQLVRSITGFCDAGIFNSNKDVVKSAWNTINSKRPKIVTSINSHTKGMFSIKARAHSKGTLVWVS